MELEMAELSKLVHDIEYRINDLDHLEYLRSRTDIAIEYLIMYLQENNQSQCQHILTNIVSMHYILCKEINDLERTKQSTLAAVPDKQGHVGRPKLKINKETLIHLRELGFTWNEISSMLLVSRWTVQRRVKELGIQNSVSYSDISDEELDQHIRNGKQTFGILAGRSVITGYLKSLGLHIQRRRIMKSLVRVDPSNSRLRWACLIKRRKYSVAGPNCLWHADGHHSLINWGFVLHGAIDGYSRLVVYLKCSTNNKAETVLRNFDDAIEKFGVPSRLRTDKGGENRLIWEKMEELRGSNRGSYIAGSSVHNQRIERLWRDVWTNVTHEYYYTFQALESEGLLDVNNVKHMYVLHYLFQPRINHTINHFISGWNKHPLRTEKNWSPEKLWTKGMMDINNKDVLPVAELQEVPAIDDLTWYGFDVNAPHPTEIETNDIVVEDFECPFNMEELQLLGSVDPLKYSCSYGTDIYIEILEALDVIHIF